MSSKREEERNEKIIRGLLKLPPNRRCINCNSLGPQYVCTNFWTFVCTTCSGIHREFTHRVKSVSMAKFTLQEVDALQKGGNQRAREIYLMAWDPQINRLPDNSNVDKVRDFIKNVYVNKKYAVEKSSDKPPKDPQGLRNHEGETRRASSYHSFSQSPPYDFQYEERRYGKHAPALTRKPGSDRGLYDGKLASFLSPTRFGDNANDDRFANEGSNPRASDYSVSSGGDPFRSDVLSPSSQRGLGSPSSETYHTDKHKSDANSRSDGGRAFHPQRSASAGSFGSFDSNSMSFKSVNSTGFPEVASEPEPSSEFSHNEPSSLPSLGQSSVSGTVNGFDPFGASFAPQTITSRPPPGSNSQLLESSPSQSVDLFQQSPISSVSTFTEQQAPPVPQPSSIDLFSTLSQQQSAAASNVVMPENGGWATFDTTQKSTYTENCAPAALPSSEENASGNFNPFSFEQGPSYSTYPEPPASSHTFWHGLQDVDSTTTNTPFWNAFEDSTEQPIQNVLKNSEQAADLSLGFGAYEVLNNQGNINIPDESGPPSSSSLSSHFSMPLHDFSMVPAAAGVHSIATDHKPNNPFDLPYDSDIGSDNVLWDMNSLHDSLPNAPTSASYVGEVNQSWFLENSVSSYVPGGVTFDHPSGSLGLIAAQTPASQISNIPAQGPVASVGGNPFA